MVRGAFGGGRELRRDVPQKDIEETLRVGCGKPAPAMTGRCSEARMILLSRAFIRKRMISMATTASVAATSFAMAQHPARHRHAPERIQYATAWQEYMEVRALLSRDAVVMRQMMADAATEPSGEVCCGSAATMAPPNQGVVAMAKAEPAHGRETRLRQLAEEIAAARQREITLMQNAVSAGASSVAPLPERSHALLRQSGSVAGPAMRDGRGMLQ
jgi:hypothetical protein